MNKPVLLLAALALASTASAEQIDKSLNLGNSTFGMKLTADAQVNRQGGQMTSGGDISFKAKLFGGSATFRTDLDGAWGNGSRYARGFGSVDLLGVGSFSFDRTKNMHGQSIIGNYKKTLFDAPIIDVEKQFTVWGVPCIVMAEVAAYGEVGGDYEWRMNGLFNQNDDEYRFQVYTALGSYAEVTAGPGSGLTGVGVYGRVKLGELRLALEQDRKASNLNTINHFAGVAEYSRGDYEIGIKAWFAGIEESVAVLTKDGRRDVLKKHIFN